MPTVTINITDRGTPTSDGKESAVGHIYFMHGKVVDIEKMKVFK